MSGVYSEIDGYTRSKFFKKIDNDGKSSIDVFTKTLNVKTIDQPLSSRIKTITPLSNATWSAINLLYEFSGDIQELGEMCLRVGLSTCSTGAYVDYPGLKIVERFTMYTDANNVVVNCENFYDWVNTFIDQLPPAKKAAILSMAGGTSYTGGTDVIVPLGFCLWYSQLQNQGKTELNTLPAYKLNNPLRISIGLRTPTSCVTGGADAPTFTDTPTVYFYDYITHPSILEKKKKKPYYVKCLVPEYIKSNTAASPDTALNVDISTFQADYNSFQVIAQKASDIAAGNFTATVPIDKVVKLTMDRDVYNVFETNLGVNSSEKLIEFDKMMHCSRLVDATSNIVELHFNVPAEFNFVYDNMLGLIHGSKYKNKFITVKLTGTSGETYPITICGLAHAYIYIDEYGNLIKQL